MRNAISNTRTPQRASSIKTRIKTWKQVPTEQSDLLREHLPLKQGLRLANNPYKYTNCELREHLPLKQGLRLVRTCVYAFHSCPQRASSIKTRIKTLLITGVNHKALELSEHLPLKQGLRPLITTDKGVVQWLSESIFH